MCDASGVALGDEPYLFRICADGISRHCVPEVEMMSILCALIGL
ncbi:hypothetical protein MTR67_022896 [Solanum verrucosum]|uniref:Uncharacterized protein n=1 Tax=Solanum verrucosum TaxID=315347 RepID=A0AAF0TRB8_SOLVR|nr:hypothetical protein MTR67_022896 [Solanum verrucosum]